MARRVTVTGRASSISPSACAGYQGWVSMRMTSAHREDQPHCTQIGMRLSVLNNRNLTDRCSFFVWCCGPPAPVADRRSDRSESDNSIGRIDDAIDERRIYVVKLKRLAVKERKPSPIWLTARASHHKRFADTGTNRRRSSYTHKRLLIESRTGPLFGKIKKMRGHAGQSHACAVGHWQFQAN